MGVYIVIFKQDPEREWQVPVLGLLPRVVAAIEEAASKNAQLAGTLSGMPRASVDLSAELRIARKCALGIETEEERSTELACVAEAEALAGHGEQALVTATEIITRAAEPKEEGQARPGENFGVSPMQDILVEPSQVDRRMPFRRLAEALASVGDREAFKQLLIPGAYFEDTAQELCSLLFQLYPEQTAQVSEAISRVLDEEDGGRLGLVG